MPQSDMSPIAKISPEAHEDSTMLINVSHSTSVLGEEEVGGNLIVYVGPLTHQNSSAELIVSEERPVSEVHPGILDIVGVSADSFVLSFGDY